MDYLDLLAWQKSMDLAEAVYLHTAEFPLEERYGLTSSLGSLCELETQIELAVRLKLLSEERASRLRPASEEVGRIVNGLLRSKQR